MKKYNITICFLSLMTCIGCAATEEIQAYQQSCQERLEAGTFVPEVGDCNTDWFCSYYEPCCVCSVEEQRNYVLMYKN